jgi:hypothetical protein
MDTPVELSIREILAVTTDVAGYLYDQTRKRRVPIDASPAPSAHTLSAMHSTDVNLANTKSYYALSSGHTKVTPNHQRSVNASLDNGSEVNMMPRRKFE